jgi:hypothetical protein
VACSSCGKIATIDIEVGKPIPSQWCYWGKINVNEMKTSKHVYKIEAFDTTDEPMKFKRVINDEYDPTAKKKVVEEWECHDCCGCDKS